MTDKVKLHISEGEVKNSIEQHLQYQKNLGNLIFFRQNAGDFIEMRGESRRRIKGSPAGTADFMVIQPVSIGLAYFGQPKSSPYHGTRVTFLECKSSTGTQSDKQREFEEEVKEMNCRYFVVRHVDEAIEALK